MDGSRPAELRDTGPVSYTHLDVYKRQLLNRVWGYDYIGESRTLDMHVKTLRAKLADNAEAPKYIKTVRGVGYRFIG